MENITQAYSKKSKILLVLNNYTLFTKYIALHKRVK